MKKILLTAISIIYTITFSIGITGCGTIENITDISENHPTTISNTNVTNNPNVTSEATIPILPSSSPSGDNITVKDYNQFIKKVWVVKSWTTNEAYDNYSSFCIFKIENGKIEGKFATTSIAIPDERYYSPGYLGNLTGTINNDKAECQFNDKDGNNGNITLVFKKSDEIEATISYASKSKYNKDKSLDGTFQFRPYNLKDIDGFNPFKDQSFTVDLNSWGNVKFVSGKILGGTHIPTVAYLTNKDNDILYDFTWAIPNNVDFYAVSFQDVNKDGLKDIIIIYGVGEYIPEDCYVKIFSQNANGLFTIDDLTEEINDSVKNKDIKSITDYLSKKY